MRQFSALPLLAIGAIVFLGGCNSNNEGKIEGTILTLFFNGNSIQHALSNSPKKDLVGTFLTWNAIKWAQKMNFRTFDFAGVDPIPKTKKEKGIYFYAEKFGGKKYEYFSYTKNKCVRFK